MIPKSFLFNTNSICIITFSKDASSFKFKNSKIQKSEEKKNKKKKNGQLEDQKFPSLQFFKARHFRITVISTIEFKTRVPFQHPTNSK